MPQAPEDQRARYSAAVREQVEYLSRQGWYHSIELPDGTVIPGLIPVEALRRRLAAFPIPERLDGKRVLDIGAWTGWCTFELERRGAEVLAVDYKPLDEFFAARELLASRAAFQALDVAEISPASVGRFDYVLFFGVLYHLRDPLGALERVCAVTTDTAFVESYVIADPEPAPDGAPGRCFLEFFETDQLGGQIDNWFAPTVGCLLALCRSAGFAQVKLEYVEDGRAGVTCRRRWDAGQAAPGAPAPWIHSAVNNRTGDVYFHPHKDEYICLYFQSPQPDLAKEDLRIEVDGLGAPALALANLGRQGWQANLRVPPGLEPGPHRVRLRTPESPLSNEFEIVMRANAFEAESPGQAAVVFLPEEEAAPPPELYQAESNVTRSPVFQGVRGERLCCRFRSSESGLTRAGLLVELDGRPLPVLFLTDLGSGAWQTNSQLPAGCARGRHRVRLRTARSRFSQPLEIEFAPGPAT